METIKIPKIPTEYVCGMCDYITSNKKDYRKHLATDKHHFNANSTKFNQKSPKIPKVFICGCGKVYKERSGLWKHKNKGNCSVLSSETNIIENSDENNIISSEPTDKDLILMLIKQNTDLMELLKNGTHNNNNNNTTNSHNKAFNLQFFLNETCKDAMNISDFLDSIQLQLSDLEKMEEIGFVEGISNIIIKKLNALDVSKRPIHCTDKKRETIYIKDQGVWEKDVENIKIRGFVKKVAGKNARLLQVFKEKHPDYNQYHSKYSTQYNKLVIEAFGGKGDNDLEKEDKIIRNITKNILVDK